MDQEKPRPTHVAHAESLQCIYLLIAGVVLVDNASMTKVEIFQKFPGIYPLLHLKSI
jgi:hypothetical protein